MCAARIRRRRAAASSAVVAAATTTRRIRRCDEPVERREPLARPGPGAARTGRRAAFPSRGRTRRRRRARTTGSRRRAAARRARRRRPRRAGVPRCAQSRGELRERERIGGARERRQRACAGPAARDERAARGGAASRPQSRRLRRQRRRGVHRGDVERAACGRVRNAESDYALRQSRARCDPSRLRRRPTARGRFHASPYLLLTLTPLFWACNWMIGRACTTTSRRWR